MDCSPPGSSRPRDFPGKNSGVGCHFLLQGIFSTQDRARVSHIVGRCFTVWATREAKDSVGPPKYRSLFMPHLSFCRKKGSTSHTFPEFQRVKQVLIRGVRECRKINSAMMGPGTVSSLGYAHSNLVHYLWVLLQKLRSPPRWKMVTSGWTQVWASDWFDWWLRLLEDHPLPHHQAFRKKSCILYPYSKFCL